MQRSALISYLPSPSEIASTGHSPAQAPQEMQSSEIMYAMVYDLHKNIFVKYIVAHIFFFSSAFLKFSLFFTKKDMLFL
jgi:hypothetical protein